MKKLGLIIALFSVLLWNISALAQTFNVGGVNTAQYPKVVASFLALKADGSSYTDLTLDDFRVVDNGKVIPKAELELVCNDPPMSIVLVVDQSGSMTNNQPFYDSKWMWAREAIESFLSQVRMIEGSAIAVTTFGNFSYLRCPFVDKNVDYKKTILDSLDATLLGGSTNFNKAFFGDPYNPPTEIGNDRPIQMLANRPPNQRRIIIFLTDGQHDLNNGPVLTDSIIKELKYHNIQCYAVTVKDTLNRELESISYSSGGKYFWVQDRAGLKNIYSVIANDINYKIMCDLMWNTTPSCDELGTFREAQISFLRENLSVTKHYKLPSESISYLESSGQLLPFSNINVGAYEDQEITVTARTSDYKINGIKITPDTYFKVIDWGDGTGVEPTWPITVAKNSPLKIKVRFTQLNAKQFRKATLQFVSSPCNLDMPITGGISQVTLVQPIGGEVFSTCDTITIVWGGVDANTPVNLQYSSNNGANWRVIKNNATGFSYRWIPPFAGTQFRIRVSVAPVSSYLWAISLGGSMEDRASSLVAMKSQPYLYICGSYEKSANFKNFTVNSDYETGKDIFVAKYDKDGNPLWVEVGGSRNVDSASGISLHSSGSVYVSGTIYSGAKFGPSQYIMEQETSPYMMVARYGKDGGVPLVRYIGGEGFYTSIKAWGRAVYCDEANNKVYVRGTYTGELKVPEKNINLPRSTNPTNFTAIYNLNLDLQSAQAGWTASMNSMFSKTNDYDNDGIIYSCGEFKSTQKFGDYTITSAGGADGFINKYGGSPSSSDQSPNSFTVEAPLMSFSQQVLDLGYCTFGSSVTNTFTKVLRNMGSLPVEIINVNVSGVNATDFEPAEDYIGRIIPPKDSIDIAIRFNARDLDIRTASFEVVGSCNSTITVDLKGIGTCDATAMPVNFGQVTINKSSDSTVNCIFYNTNDAQIDITPTLISQIGSHKYMYELIDPATGKAPTKVTVAPKSCYPLRVIYKPTSPGKHFAQIDYRMPELCNNVLTNLEGEGVNADLKIHNIDWGRRRQLSTNDTLLVVENNNSIVVKIPNKNISFQYPVADGEFTLDLSKFTTPDISIPANDRITIPIRFTPKSDVDYFNNLLIQVEFLANPLVVNLGGSGFLPKIQTEWSCPPSPKVNTNSVGYLKISNPSTSSELKIDNIVFASGADFKPVNPVEFGNRTIGRESEIEIPVYFNPSTSGSKSDLLTIRHDAYDGTFASAWDMATLETKCNVMGIDFTSSVDFGSLLICDDNILPVTINNFSGDSVLNIKKSYISITGADASFFTVVLNNDLSINGGESTTFDVRFSPIEARSYSAMLNIPNSLGFDIKIPLAGSAELMTISSPESKLEITPGAFKTIIVEGKIAKIENSVVDSLTIIVYYDKKVLAPKDNKYKSLLTAWTWTADFSTYGKIIFGGKGNLPTPFDGEILSVDLTSYLGEQTKADVSYEIVYPCDNFKDKAIEMELSGVCFIDGRLVTVSGTPFALTQPEPNPVRGRLDLNYSVGFDVFTNIEIYNTLGEKVKVLVSSEKKAGTYQEYANIDGLSAGVYMLRMISGPYVETRTIIIER